MALDFLIDWPWLSLRLVFDTAALILIWLVQLVIYPVFTRMSRNEFRTWHPVYTWRVTLVVMPVMLGQLGVYILAMFSTDSPLSRVNFILIGLIWVLTFVQAVPIHRAIGKADDHYTPAKRLLRLNWYRTILWTLVWLISMGQLLSGMGGYE